MCTESSNHHVITSINGSGTKTTQVRMTYPATSPSNCCSRCCIPTQYGWPLGACVATCAMDSTCPHNDTQTRQCQFWCWVGTHDVPSYCTALLVHESTVRRTVVRSHCCWSFMNVNKSEPGFPPGYVFRAKSIQLQPPISNNQASCITTGHTVHA